MKSVFKTNEHECDLCIIGGGLSGMCAGIAAARHGIKVVIMQDRPLYGGNASSEIRMWVSGAGGKNCRETGIIEEIMLENLYRNPERGYPVWDSILYEFVMNEENITSIMNCSCFDADMKGSEIASVTGWQTTTQSFHTVRAKYFADCSGVQPIIRCKFLGTFSMLAISFLFADICNGNNGKGSLAGNTLLYKWREYLRSDSLIPPQET